MLFGPITTRLPSTRFSTLLNHLNVWAKKTGWQANYLLVKNQNGHILAAMPCFVKYHSYGEYVFDWAWANAYQEAGLEYYPKLINAIPFTPSTGPRIGFSTELDAQARDELAIQMFAQLQNEARRIGLSGIHSLFPNPDQTEYAAPNNFMQRLGYQFHWFNNNEGKPYASFDDFLSTFNSRKRKTLKKERQKVAEQGISVVMKSASEVSAKEWEMFYMLYHRTYLKRSGATGYLNREFFEAIARTLSEHVVLACAYYEQTFVAGALYFKDDKTLYGRYWGAQAEFDGVHFEACYYQGIDYAIQHGLERFDPGAQGEHKIQRGFTPIKTCSYHWLSHPQFHQAIANFLEEESKQVEHYIDDARTYLPFKEGTTCVDRDCLITR